MQTEMTQVTADTFKQMAQVCTRIDRPTFLYGSPGMGKSDIHRQIAAELGGIEASDAVYLGQSRWEYGDVLFIDVRASQWDAVDTRGIPYRDDDSNTCWAIPKFLPDEKECARFKYVIIFLDELNSAAHSVQAALYQLCLDRQLGDYKCPPNVRIMAAGNLATDRAVVNRTSSALADRFFNAELLPNAEGWKLWAIDNDVHIACVAFINLRPDMLYAFDAKSPSMSQATARGWEYVSDALKECEASGINGSVEAALIESKLGNAVASEFLGFLPIYRDMENPDAVLLDPESAAISDNVAVNYAMSLALADRASPDNIDRVLRYGERLRDDERAGPEYMTLLAQTAAKRHPEVKQTASFIKWGTKNQGVFI